MTLQNKIAGTWHPATEREVRAIASTWEDSCVAEKMAAPENPNILILPHAGWAYSGKIAWRAVRLVRGARFKRVVVLAPSHRVWIENRLVAPEANTVSTSLGEIQIDKEWTDRLALRAPVLRNDKVHENEHSAQIEYPLLKLALGSDFKLAPLIVGSLGPDQMAMCASALAQLIDKDTLLVISSDFTHYGSDFSYTPYGTDGGEKVRERVAAVDADAFSYVEKRDADAFAAYVAKTGATICGHVPIELAVRALPAKASFSRIAYATSGDDDREFSRFVCYLSAAGRAEWSGEGEHVLDGEARSFLLRVARESMEYAVRNGKALPRGHFTASAPKTTLAKMGTFVTLNDKVSGALRGCIGEILPMRPLVEAVAARAVDSALHDPRFPPVAESELANLRVEVSALTPPASVKSWRDIVLGRDGMTLEKGGAFAVFLPQVAPEQGWDLPTTLTYLSQKAGLSADAWREGASFETFQAEVFHE